MQTEAIQQLGEKAVFTSKKQSLFLSVLIVLLISPFIMFKIEAQTGTGNLGLVLDPTQGPAGTVVTVTFDVYSESASIYRGLTYVLVWDIGGWSENAASWQDVSDQSKWTTIIGTANWTAGHLEGKAIIPVESKDEAGDHIIYAVNQQGLGSTADYWWGFFEIPPGGNVVHSEISGTCVLSVENNPDKSGFELGGDFNTYTHTTHESDYEISYYNFSRGGHVTIQTYGKYDINSNQFVVDNILIDDNSGPTDVRKTDFVDFYIFQDTDVIIQYKEPSGSWGCIIATSTYGGPLAPEVVFMRSVRDDMVGSNTVGKSIVKGWNSFYYSWSPPIAAAIAESNVLRSVFSIALMPLLGTMHVVAYQYNLLAPINPTFASVTSFITAALLSIAIYIALPIFLLMLLYKRYGKGTFKFSFLQKKPR